jgi:hypothetical protein
VVFDTAIVDLTEKFGSPPKWLRFPKLEKHYATARSLSVNLMRSHDRDTRNTGGNDSPRPTILGR